MTRLWSCIVTVCSAAACTHTTPPGTAKPRASQSTAVGTAPAPAPIAGCIGSCNIGDACETATADLSCTCEWTAQDTSGGAQGPRPTPEWVCHSTAMYPDSVRSDGCPSGVPTAHASCSDALVCAYPKANRIIEQWSCIDKNWVQGETQYLQVLP